MSRARGMLYAAAKVSNERMRAAFIVPRTENVEFDSGSLDGFDAAHIP